MGYQPLESLLPKAANSIYKLVRVASCRATELAEGKPKLIANPSSDKVATIALEEIAAGKVVIKEVEDQFMPPKKAGGKEDAKQQEEQLAAQ